MVGGLSIGQAAEKFGIKYDAVQKRSRREGWERAPEKPLPDKVQLERTRELSALVRESWAERGERHRSAMFDLASRAIGEAKVPAPKNWRDLETADKIARRAAGLEDADAQGRTIVNLALLGEAEPAVLEIRPESVPTETDSYAENGLENRSPDSVDLSHQ
jgi:transposase